MKKLIPLIILFTIVTSDIKGQKIYIGGGVFGTSSTTIIPEEKTRIGIEGIFEIQPFNVGLVASVSPNLIFRDYHYGILLSAPVEIKWLIGNKFKVYPALGYLFRTHSFSGTSLGFGMELEINKNLKAGIKCNRIGGIYRSSEYDRDLANHAEICIQIGAYLLKRIK